MDVIEVAAVLAGRYEIYKEIGRGGKSVVYLAMDTHLMDKRVAVKVVKKDIDGYLLKIAQDSLWMELTTLTKIDHPGVSRIVDFIDGNTAWYVVMDFIDGESLKDLLRECGPQSEEYVVDWAKQLCVILSYLISISYLPSETLVISPFCLRPRIVSFMPYSTIRIAILPSNNWYSMWYRQLSISRNISI